MTMTVGGRAGALVGIGVVLVVPLFVLLPVKVVVVVVLLAKTVVVLLTRTVVVVALQDSHKMPPPLANPAKAWPDMPSDPSSYNFATDGTVIFVISP